jgi:ubiquinone/menaquinone biosynthesis C-methylase UbiE
MTGNKPENSPSPKKQVTCPTCCCFTFDNFLRRYVQNPYKILKPYIRPGMTILDVGPGQGYFTIPLAVLNGENGKVIAADLRPSMLKAIRRRAVKASLDKRITFHQAMKDNIGITEALDFCLAFWMVHEVPDRQRFLGEIYNLLKPGGSFLFAEPKIHVSKTSFTTSLDILKGLGCKVVEEPKIFFSQAAVLKKG